MMATFLKMLQISKRQFYFVQFYFESEVRKKGKHGPADGWKQVDNMFCSAKKFRFIYITAQYVRTAVRGNIKLILKQAHLWERRQQEVLKL